MKSGFFLRILLWVSLLELPASLCAQSPAEIIAVLGSARMQGRGYAHHGDARASGYLTGLMKNTGILPFNGSYLQTFGLDVNTFPAAMHLEVNGKKLKPVEDFIAEPSSPSLNGSFMVRTVPVQAILENRADVLLASYRGEVVCIGSTREKLSREQQSLVREWRLRQVYLNPFGLKGIIETSTDPLAFGTATHLSAIPLLTLRAGAVGDSVRQIRVNIDNVWKEHYVTQNLAGYIPGTVCPDSLVVFTAHYDHLGLMGRGTYFPGANDNASGVAMVLQLMRHVAADPQRFSVACVFFSGEEVGLLGSKYFAEHPPFPLSKVKFLVNLDLVGTGSDGIMVVNATEFQQAFEKLNSLNQEGGFVKEIRKRGKACNSDHCSFFEKGVPCFFIYTLGEISAYHNLNDRPETLPLTAFDEVVKLLSGFVAVF